MKVLGLLLLIALYAEAQMYKCVDARGVTQYADQPGPGCKEVAIKPSPPLSGAVRAPHDDFAGKEADLKRRQLAREASAAQERQALEKRCAKARNEYSTLTSGIRLYTRNEKGERVFVDDATREQRIAQLTQDLRGCP